MKRLFARLRGAQTIGTGAILIALFSIVSKLLGLMRYSFMAALFGTGPIADSYMAAFRIPDFIYNTLVLGALSTAFIPVFLDMYRRGQKKTPHDLGVEASEEGLASINMDYGKQLSSFTLPTVASLIPAKEIVYEE